MTQLDPVDNANPVDEIWNWRSNITGGLARLDERSGYSDWIKKVQTWQTDNATRARRGQPLIPVAPDQVEGDTGTPCVPGAPGPCTFTVALDPNGAATQNTGRPFVYWFGDAIIMKQTGGGPQYIQYTSGAGWSFNKISDIPVGKDANGKVILQPHNFVYEFSTCSASLIPPSSACQHQTPPGKLQ